MSWLTYNRKKLFFGSGLLLVIIVGIVLNYWLAPKPVLPEQSKPSSPHLQAYISDGRFYLIDILSGEVQYSYALPAEYVPSRISAQKIIGTVDKSLFAWFVPDVGIVVHRVKTNESNVVAQPSAWFFENPHFAFFGDSHSLWFIDNQGQEMIRVDVNLDTVSNQTIPYPYGSQFLVSPDAKRVLMVEGYGQTRGNPGYFVSTADIIEIDRFTTSSEISQRDWVVWSNDSSLILGVVDDSLQTVYSFSGAGVGHRFVDIEENDQLIDFFHQDSFVLLQSSSTLYLFDTETLTVVRRVPVDLFGRLRSYSFLSFDNEGLVIEEEVKSREAVSYRLWKSDWFGNLEMVVPVYERRLVTDVEFEAIDSEPPPGEENADR
jgi:hypothetical protein